MKKALTRRQFMKGAAGTVACLGVMVLPLDSAADARCRSCGATTKRNLASALLPLAIDPVRYCPNCGISLRTNSHEIDCPDYEQCVSLGVAICGDPAAKGSPCFRVPFPNHKLLVGADTSKKDIAALKF